MKKAWLAGMVLAFGIAATIAWAQPEPERNEPAPGADRPPRPERPERINPDTNDDCIVDDAEAAAASKAMIDRFKDALPRMKERMDRRGGTGRPPAMAAGVDTDQDWTISAEEEAAFAERMKGRWQERNEVILKHYDANADGKLDADEQKAAKTALAFAEDMGQNMRQRALRETRTRRETRGERPRGERPRGDRPEAR